MICVISLLRFKTGISPPSRASPARFILRTILRLELTDAERLALLDSQRAGLGDMDFCIKVVDEMEVTRTGKFKVFVSDLE